MRLLLAVLAFTLASSAQTSFAALGATYNPGATPAIAGTALYARTINDTGTHAFTVVDALPSSIKPFTVTTNVAAGVAQRVLTINGIGIYIPTAAGISFNGTNTGWQWNGGALAAIPVKDKWTVTPNVRFLKSSISGSDYQVMVGVLFGWRW